MKPEELSIYIGEIDDDLITGAKKKRSIHKKVIMIAGSVAACAVLAVTGVFLMTHQKPTTEVSVPGTGGYTEQGDRPASGNATGGEISEGLLIESSGDGISGFSSHIPTFDKVRPICDLHPNSSASSHQMRVSSRFRSVSPGVFAFGPVRSVQAFSHFRSCGITSPNISRTSPPWRDSR